MWRPSIKGVAEAHKAETSLIEPMIHFFLDNHQSSNIHCILNSLGNPFNELL